MAAFPTLFRPGPLFLFLTACLSSSGAPPIPPLVNGDFEAAGEGGWSYLGHNDGSHGVFSDPTRPGTHTYLLQLSGGAGPGFAALSQVLQLEKGSVYRLHLDLWHSGANLPPRSTGRHSAALQDATVFDRALDSPDLGRGWTTSSALFRAAEERPVLQIRLTGQSLDREVSTTALDAVLVEKVDAKLPLPLLPGKPLAPLRPRSSLPLALGFDTSEASLGSLQDFRDRFGDTPALAQVRYDWHDASAPALWPGLTAWARHGVLPIVSIPWFPEDLAGFPSEASQTRWRQFAAAARRWRYPCILRLAPEMDLCFSPSEAAGFAAAWRTLHGIFQEAGARNALWLWSPSQWSEANHAFFPGPDWVDFVGFTTRDPDPLSLLRQQTAFARQRYPGLALVVAGSTGPVPSPASLVRSFPELAFFTLGDLTSAPPGPGSPAAEAVARALRHPSISPAVPQIQPPLLHVRLIRNGPRLSIVLLHQGRRDARPPSLIDLEVWQGHPYLEGQPLKGYHSIALRPGQRKTIRLTLPDEASQTAHVLVDLAADPRFLPAHPDDFDWATDPDLLILPVP